MKSNIVPDANWNESKLIQGFKKLLEIFLNESQLIEGLGGFITLTCCAYYDG